MPPQRNNKKAPIFSVFIWIVLAAVCIQGYLLLSKKNQVETGAPDNVAALAKGRPVSLFRLPGLKKKPAPSPKVKPAPRPPTSAGDIAVVIDDWGYNRSHCLLLSDIPIPLGIAVLPNLTYSQEIIKCALDNGKEPMLHLPLEPHNMRDAFEGDYLLTTQMPPSVVKKQLVKILNEMPGVLGVNNHTGSKGTEDDVLMTLIMAELKRRGIFFVDSVTSDRSVCGLVAKKLKMRIARRDVFLDNRNERSSIENEFAAVARIAKRKGHVLVIGHDRALTLQILGEQVSKLKAQGFEFISLRDYIRKYEYPGN